MEAAISASMLAARFSCVNHPASNRPFHGRDRASEQYGLAPAFHHGPRPLLAERHARSFGKPLRCSIFCRVDGRFHCRHNRQRSLRRTHAPAAHGGLLRSMDFLLYRLCYLSSFFRTYIAVLPHTADRELLAALIAVLRQTQRSNLSLALIESGDPLATAEVEMLLTAPADAAPVPDCRKTIDWERKVRLLLGRNAVSA